MGKTSSPVTLMAVARAAGVSISTASRVLNRSEVAVPISEKTRQAVLEAAQTLGYAPSLAARALRSGSTRTLGVLGTSPEFFQIRTAHSRSHGSFVGEILTGLFDAATTRGYNLTFLTGIESRSGSEMDVLAGFGLSDGLLVLNRDLGAEDLCASALRLYARPMVCLLDYREGDRHVAAPDDFGGGKLATRELIRRGHRRIAFVRDRGFDDIFGRRHAGWAEALAGGGLPAPPVVGDVSSLSPDELRALDCTAAVCANRPCAEKFAAVCEAAGIRIPGEMEILDFFHSAPDPHGAGGTPDPVAAEFAGVDSPLAHIVASGTGLLVDLIEGHPPATPHQLFPFTLRHGRTCPAR
jgi:LacI family transcriptional regulator